MTCELLYLENQFIRSQSNQLSFENVLNIITDGDLVTILMNMRSLPKLFQFRTYTTTLNVKGYFLFVNPTLVLQLDIACEDVLLDRMLNANQSPLLHLFSFMRKQRFELEPEIEVLLEESGLESLKVLFVKREGLLTEGSHLK